MKNNSFIHKIFFVTILIISQQLSGSAFGLSLIGPPRSLLKPEQSAFAFEFGYSQMDLESFGDVTETTLGLAVPDYSKYQIEKLKTIRPAIRLDTNVFENWDLFLRFGVADASCDLNEEQAGGTKGWQFDDFDGNFGFSWGIGTRTTFYQQDNTSWGTTIQLNWINPGDSDITGTNPNTGNTFSGTAEIDYWEAQLAIGPTIEYDSVRVYGGPFLHFVNGDLDISGSTTTPIPVGTSMDTSHDIKEKSELGGFLGTQIYLGNNSTLFTEVEFTGDAWGIGIGTAWKF